MESTGRTPAKRVFAISERPAKEGEARGKGWFTAIGAGWMNDDGALSITLDALPTSGKLWVRDWDAERDSPKKDRKPAERDGCATRNLGDSEPPF